MIPENKLWEIDDAKLTHLDPDENSEQVRMNAKPGSIAYINFVGSIQRQTAKQITFFIRNYRQVIDYLL